MLNSIYFVRVQSSTAKITIHPFLTGITTLLISVTGHFSFPFSWFTNRYSIPLLRSREQIVSHPSRCFALLMRLHCDRPPFHRRCCESQRILNKKNLSWHLFEWIWLTRKLSSRIATSIDSNETMNFVWEFVQQLMSYHPFAWRYSSVLTQMASRCQHGSRLLVPGGTWFVSEKRFSNGKAALLAWKSTKTKRKKT